MRRLVTGMIVLGVALMFVWAALAENSKGAEQLKIAAGSQAPVGFPHHRHQKALDDCLTCHALFPQEAGSIARAKGENKLAPKQVMNTLCIQCHRDRKQAGQASGPIGCAKCHIKE